jgi:hypothetical protein
MPDLHEWISERVAETQRIAEAARGHGEGRWHHETGYHSGRVEDERGETVVYDEGAPLEEEAAHIALHDPANVLRRCAADRKILAVHAPRDRRWYDDYVCEGCGYDGADYCSEPNTPHVNDCPTLLALAEGYGLTEEQRAALDRPEAERPAPSQSTMPPIIQEHMTALTERILGTRLVEPRLLVKVVGPAPMPMPEWLREDLGLPAPDPEPTTGERAFAVVEPHPGALALYKTATNPEA